MSAFNAAFSPFLRRTWTCRACLRSQQRSTFAQPNILASRGAIRKTFATKVDAATNPIGKTSKRRRRLLIAGGGLAIGAGVVTINDDAKHAYVAAQRSYRVVGTLVLNIKEYVLVTNLLGHCMANGPPCLVTATPSSMTATQTTPRD